MAYSRQWFENYYDCNSFATCQFIHKHSFFFPEIVFPICGLKIHHLDGSVPSNANFIGKSTNLVQREQMHWFIKKQWNVCVYIHKTPNNGVFEWFRIKTFLNYVLDFSILIEFTAV